MRSICISKQRNYVVLLSPPAGEMGFKVTAIR